MPDLQSNLSEIELRQGQLRLSVCPGLGGAITRLSIDGHDVLRPWDGSDNVRKTGCFVLAPFSNRVEEGAFEHDGTRYPLNRLSPDFPLPIHGVAWKRAWTVTEQNTSTIVLSLSHVPQDASITDWPFAFELKQRIQLSEEGVSLALNLRNSDSRSAPAGLGWHPFFPRHDGCELQFRAESVWQNNTHNLPSELTEIPAQWDFSSGRSLEEPGLDNCFVNHAGPVHIHWPQQGVDLTMAASEALDHLVVFTPAAERGFFAAEPVTHANNALNMDDPAANGIRILSPGEAMQVNCRLQIQRTARTSLA